VDSESIGEPVEQEYGPLEVPEVWGLPEQSDLLWPNLDPILVRRHGFYISPDDRLIMPVFRDGGMVFWTARYVGQYNDPNIPKYISAKAKKQYWLSDEQYPTGDLFICESIVDACYMSQLGQSVGLLGTTYNASLDNWMRSAKRVIVAFDGDMIGKFKGMELAVYLKANKVGKQVLMLPTPWNKDPVDLQLDELKQLVKGLE
jgi:DNA primase